MEKYLRFLQTLFIVAALCSISRISATDAVDDFDADEASVEVETEPSPPIDVPYESPVITDKSKVYLSDHFDDVAQFNKRWIKSRAMKEGISEDIAKYDGVWEVEAPQKDALSGDLGLVLKSKAKHAAIASPLTKPFTFNAKPLIVQYEVILQEGQECGGAYLKLLSEGADTKNLAQFTDKSPYTIMFGPDKCGNDHKLHFIFRHRNPLNGSIEEKHCKKPKERLEDFFSDKLPHLYTLIVNPDNTFEIKIDRQVVNSGSLLEDFTPSVNPPAEIDDPNDKKPDDWDEREKVPDPDAVKPEDWDEDAPAQIIDEFATMPAGWLENEPTHIPDPNAKMPEDWDTEMDGAWEPPLIDNPVCVDAPGCGSWEPPLINNPNYKGKWRAALIDNPNYKGKWRPRRIGNPDYFEDKEPFKMHTVSAVGFELWSMSKDILFDNIIITDDIQVSEQWAADTFDKKRQKIARDSVTLWGRTMKALNYMPKTWAVYFIYCSIPVVIYIWYLYSCVREESLVQRIANLTNEYPILWGVYIIVLGIPVVFILYLCCKPSSSASRTKENEELRRAAEKKKTDEITADDIPETSGIRKEEEREEINEEDEDREKYSDKDDDDDDDEAEESKKPEVASVSQGGEGDAPRKRKPRGEPPASNPYW